MQSNYFQVKSHSELLDGHEFEKVKMLFPIQPGTDIVDRSRHWRQRGPERQGKNQGPALDFGLTSGPVISGSLQGKEVLGDHDHICTAGPWGPEEALFIRVGREFL